jgi:hypothetical protein
VTSPAGVAELKSLLFGIPLPAEKPALLEYAVRQRAEPALIDSLQELPDRKYESLDEVAEELLRVQPRTVEKTETPHAESGAPPGGDDYV